MVNLDIEIKTISQELRTIVNSIGRAMERYKDQGYMYQHFLDHEIKYIPVLIYLFEAEGYETCQTESHCIKIIFNE